MLAIYHSKDLDGFTSGAIIKKKYPEAILIGYDYGDKIKLKIKNEPIIMADVSFPMEKMFEISKSSNNQLTWIDHHISAINKYENFEHKNFCNAILKNGISACELTWNYLFPKIEMPLAVKLLGEYDTWRNQDIYNWENMVLPFQFGMKLYCNGPENFPVEVFTDINLVYSIINEGKIILKYQNQINEIQCKKSSFEFDFCGFKAICLNGGGFNSDVFKSVFKEEKHDIMIPFQFNGKKWNFSLYTTKDNVDCSELAIRMGGGGHKKAAGFEVDDIREVFGNLI